MTDILAVNIDSAGYSGRVYSTSSNCYQSDNYIILHKLLHITNVSSLFLHCSIILYTKMWGVIMKDGTTILIYTLPDHYNPVMISAMITVYTVH